MKKEVSIPINNANKELLVTDTQDKSEYYFHDQNGLPAHLSKIIYKGKSRIVIFPYSFSRINGLSAQKIGEIEFRGWDNSDDLPNDFLSGQRIRLTAGRTKIFMRFLKQRFPKIEKLVISTTDKTKLLDKSIILNWTDMHKALVVFTHLLGHRLRENPASVCIPG